MPLSLYKRHTSKCAQRRCRHHRTYEGDERRRGFQKCSCPVHAEGTLGEVFSRKTTGTNVWAEAHRIAAVWGSANSWDATATRYVENAEQWTAHDSDAHGVTVADAAKAFLAECRARGIAESTYSKYRTFVKQIEQFSGARGVVWIDQWDISIASEFRLSWRDKARSSAKKLERMKSFFEFCHDRGWVGENPAAKLKPPVGASKAANRTPFTDAELARIYEACRRLPPQPWRNGSSEGVWTGENVLTFIMLMVYTGLRISDAATFAMKRINPNDDTIFLRQHKTGKPLSTWVPPELIARLRVMSVTSGEHPFMGPHSRRKETAADLWRRHLNKAFELVTKWDEPEPPTPHRFRHTFARILLQKGVRPADVAELLGDTEAVVLRHYARWVPERQARLTQVLKDAFADHQPLAAAAAPRE